jgi:starvation-inducible outer membrane lipoprotein
MRLVLLLLLAALGLTACETTPKAASAEQPCNCAASRGEAHQASGRTQISR